MTRWPILLTLNERAIGYVSIPSSISSTARYKLMKSQILVQDTDETLEQAQESYGQLLSSWNESIKGSSLFTNA